MSTTVSLSSPAGGGPVGPVEVSNAPGNPLPVAGAVEVTNLPDTTAVSNFPSTQNVAGTVNVGNFPATQAVSGPLTDVQLRATPVAVSGSVTVSDGSGPLSVDGSVAVNNLPSVWQVADNGGSLTVDGSVSVSNFPASTTVSNFPATQAVSGSVSVSNFPAARSANLAVTGTAAAAAGVTVTLPAVIGQFHYINSIEITMYSTAARTGTATPVVVTTTNLGPAWTFPSAGAIGTVVTVDPVLTEPLRSAVAGTATTIVCPATASVIWRVNVTYYAAP